MLPHTWLAVRVVGRSTSRYTIMGQFATRQIALRHAGEGGGVLPWRQGSVPAAGSRICLTRPYVPPLDVPWRLYG